MSSWSFSGASWWKFDFHTHTPASRDFLEGCEQHESALEGGKQAFSQRYKMHGKELLLTIFAATPIGERRATF